MLPSIAQGLIYLALWCPSITSSPLSSIASHLVSPHYRAFSELINATEDNDRHEKRDDGTVLKEYRKDNTLKVYSEGGKIKIGIKPGKTVAYRPSSKPTDSDGCKHGPSSRHCWEGDFTYLTDPETTWPEPRKHWEYNWAIDTVTLAPDGVDKEMQVINGQYPGPTLYADWGDTITVNIKSSLSSNGTGIHWHGVRQYHNNHMDGVGGVTECPIAQNETRTYTFKATQYGTSWYHSHYSVQYGEGILGGIVIRGPATADYDIDLGFYPFTDWFHAPVFTLNAMALHANGPPKGDNFLINGTHVYGDKGRHSVTNLVPGKRHLLRLANVGLNQFVHVTLEGHFFQVIAADFTPIVPYTTQSLGINIGQRYDIIIDANQPIDHYWLRVETGGGQCDGPNYATEEDKTIRALFSYDGAEGPPKEFERDPEEKPKGCADETSLVPILPKAVPLNLPKSLELSFTNEETDDNLVQWLINGSRMTVNYSNPILNDIAVGGGAFNASEDPKDNAYTVTGGEEWSYWVIQSDEKAGRVPHPVHLHGHDFFVLGHAENKTWDGDVTTLLFNNPIRRDTATLPRLGYIVLAFKADNPGAWLMHCHVPFHVSAGFSLQFIENQEKIMETIGDKGFSSFSKGCEKWNAFQTVAFPEGFTSGDSLIKKREDKRDKR